MTGFHRYFVWRVAGFPCESLEAFALESLGRELHDVILPCKSERVGWTQFWRQLIPRLEATRAALRFDEAFRMLQGRLRNLAGQERFQVAIASSAPLAYAAIARLAPLRSHRASAG